MTKAGPVLMAAMTRPATAGPMSPDSCCMTWTSALAGGSSRSLTIMGTMVFSAGWKKASTTPKMTASTYSCHSSTWPLSTRKATSATTTARSAFEMIIRLRGETRSDIAPPSSMKTARGMAAAIRTVPSARPDPVSCSASQASAMKWNWSPISEMLSPAKMSRKSCNRSGSSMAGPLGGSSGMATGVLAVVGVAVVSMLTPSR